MNDRYKILIQATDMLGVETSDPQVAGHARALGCYVRCYPNRPMKADDDSQGKVRWISSNYEERHLN